MTDLRYVTIGNDDEQVSEIEWRKIIDSDPELELLEYLFGINPLTHEKIKIKTTCGIYFSKMNNCDFTFVFENGYIVCSCCDEETWNNGKEIAAKLNSIIDIVVD